MEERLYVRIGSPTKFARALRLGVADRDDPVDVGDGLAELGFWSEGRMNQKV